MILLVLLTLITRATTRSATFRSDNNKNCTALIEGTAWRINNFTAFQAKPSGHCASYISFAFCDMNTGLELSTTCNRTLAVHSNATLSDDQYFRCVSPYVNFIYASDTLQLERWYRDPCLGEPPYDNAIAYGHIRLNLTKTQANDGVFFTGTGMHVPISSLS